MSKRSVVFGSKYNDVLKGTEHADVLFGKKGNDKLFGFDQLMQFILQHGEQALRAIQKRGAGPR